MSSSKKPLSSRSTPSSAKPGVGSRKVHHALSQQKLDGFFSPTPQPRSATPSSCHPLSKPPPSSNKPPSNGPSAVGRPKKTALSAFQDKDRGGGSSPSAPASSTSRHSHEPSPVASGSKQLATSSEIKRRKEASSVASDDPKGKGKSREIIELTDDEGDNIVKHEESCSDISEEENAPVKKKQRLSALPHPGGRSESSTRTRVRRSSSPSSSPRRADIDALPPERRSSRSTGSRPSVPAPTPVLHLSSSPPQAPNPLPPPRPIRSAMQSSPPPGLSASLASYLPANHPSPPQLFRPRNSQALAAALSLTGLRNSEEEMLKELRRERFVWETDAVFAERKGRLKEWETNRELARVNNSMRPKVRTGLEPGGPKDLERQRLAREAEKERTTKAKRALSAKRSFSGGEPSLNKQSPIASGRESRKPTGSRIQSSARPSGVIAELQRPDQFTPIPSASRPRHLSGSRPRHNRSSLPRPSSAAVKSERAPSPSIPPPSAQSRPLVPNPARTEAESLTESQFEPIAHHAHALDMSPSPSPPAKAVQPPARPPLSYRPSSDETGEPSQWSIMDHYHPDARSNPFIEHPVPLADLLPVVPTAEGMDLPDPAEYETQGTAALDGLPESQWDTGAGSMAGWSAFEAAHVHRPGAIFQHDPSRAIDVDLGLKVTKLASRSGSGATSSKPHISSQTATSSSSQTQDETGLPGTPTVHSSGVLVAGTPSPNRSPVKPRTNNSRVSPAKAVLLAQHKQHVLIRQSAPSSPSSGPSSEESIAYVGLSPGSVPVRDFIVAKDSSSSGAESAGTLELLAADLTPKAKEARKQLQDEVDPAEGVKSDKAFRGSSAKKKLVEILARAGPSRPTSSGSGLAVSPTKLLMGPPAPPSPTTPRKGSASPTKVQPHSPSRGSPLRPRPSNLLDHGQHLSESDDEDEIVPDSQSQLLLPHVAVSKLKKAIFQPVLSPIPASGAVAPSDSAAPPASKPAAKTAAPFGIFSGFGNLRYCNADDEEDPSPSVDPLLSSSAAGPSKPPPTVLSATKLEEFGFTRRRDRKPVDRGPRPGDELLEDVEPSDEEDGWVPTSATKKERAKQEFLLRWVPSPPPLHALKPTVVLRRRKAPTRHPSDPQPTGALGVAHSPTKLDGGIDSDSDSSSVVISSQTQLLPTRPPHPPPRPLVPLGATAEEEDDDDRVIPSSQATQDLLSHRQRSDPDRGYETDNDDEEEVIRSSQREEWSPISFSAKDRAHREGRRVYFAPPHQDTGRDAPPSPPRAEKESSPTDEEPGAKDEDPDRTITGPPRHLLFPSSGSGAGAQAQRTSSSSSSSGGLGTPLRLMQDARARLKAALASSSSDDDGDGAGGQETGGAVMDEVEEVERSSSLTSLSDL